MNLKMGDKVVVIAGKAKGKTGKVSKILSNDNKIIVEGINIVKKHFKPDANNQEGGIISKESPIHVSNVMLVDPKSNKGTRVGYKIDKKGNKVRISKKSNENID